MIKFENFKDVGWIIIWNINFYLYLKSMLILDVDCVNLKFFCEDNCVYLLYVI